MATVKHALRGEVPDAPFAARSFILNPDQDALRTIALEAVPNMIRTARGSMNKLLSIAKARSAANTFVISTDPELHTCQTVGTIEAARVVHLQETYLRNREVIRVDGFIGNHPECRVPVTLWMSKEGANVAAMQQILYFPVTEEDRRGFHPAFHVIYTPGLSAPGYDRGRVILVDLETYTTRILGSDYFGESKKGGLRMLNAKVYRDGGLVLHAGAKITPVHVNGRFERRLLLVMGESGTGKTTSTFSPQGNAETGFSEAIQDDMLMLHRGGRAYATENGCFAIASGLREETEPIIYRGAMAENAWLENVYTDERGELDFLKGLLTKEEVVRLREFLLRSGVTPEEFEEYASGRKTYTWTKNSRVIIPMSDIETAGDSLNLPPVYAIGVLNKNTNIIPGVVRFRTPAQAAAYFMLGETMGTAASGADAGKAKRSPFTNPFFPLRNEQMANRFMEIAHTMPSVFNFMMNTGWVGGDEKDAAAGRAMKVKIRHSSAILQALAEGSIEWVEDPDFGYDLAQAVPGVPEEILHPKRYYASQNRAHEYDDCVRKLRAERREYLARFPGIDPEIAKSL